MLRLKRVAILCLLMWLLLAPSSAVAGIKGILGVAVVGPRTTLGQDLILSYKLNDNQLVRCTLCWLDSSSSNIDLSNPITSAQLVTGTSDRNGNVVGAAIFDSGATGLGGLANGSFADNILQIPSQFSMAIWFNAPASVVQTVNILEVNGFDITFNSSTRLISFTVVTTTGTSSVIASTPISFDTWHHAMVVWDGAEMRLYVDGALNGTPVARTGVPLITFRRIFLGNFHFEGSMDDALVWRRALTSVERDQVVGLGSDFAGME